MTIKVSGVEVEVSNDCEVTVEGTKLVVKSKYADWKVGWLPNYYPYYGNSINIPANTIPQTYCGGGQGQISWTNTNLTDCQSANMQSGYAQSHAVLNKNGNLKG